MSVESALSYASLILADADVEITADKLSTLVSKANVEVEPIWTEIYTKAMDGQNLKDLFFQVQAGPTAAAPAPAAAAGGATEEKAEEKAEEAKEESDDDMGFGLFD